MKNKIKEERTKQNLTQIELAQKSGVARGVISSLENGSRTVITSKTMKKISDALLVPINQLFFLDDNPL